MKIGMKGNFGMDMIGPIIRPLLPITTNLRRTRLQGAANPACNRFIGNRHGKTAKNGNLSSYGTIIRLLVKRGKSDRLCILFVLSMIYSAPMQVIRTILGLDPGLRHTGWGVICQQDNRLSFVAAGRINPPADVPMAERLLKIAEELHAIIERLQPSEAALEETFMNNNAASALKLGQARGVAMMAAARGGLSVGEYATNKIKLAVTGYGHADKGQIQAMIGILLPGSGKLAPDAADALAVAICHAHHPVTGRNL